MPMRSVEVEAVAQADQIPADVIAFVHSHHRHVAEQIAVDGGANVRRNEPATDNREISVGIAGAAVQLLNRLRLGGVGFNVVVQIPAVVLVDDEERGHELAVNIFGRSVGTCHAFLGDDD